MYFIQYNSETCASVNYLEILILYRYSTQHVYTVCVLFSFLGKISCTCDFVNHGLYFKTGVVGQE